MKALTVQPEIPLGAPAACKASMTFSVPGPADAKAISEAPCTSFPDTELVAKARDGDTAAAREIVRLHHKRIFNFIYQITHHYHEAEDITQETFIKAFKNLHRFDTGRPFANWLFTIARRTALNHRRARRSWFSLSEDIPANDIPPDRYTEQQNQLDDLWTFARDALTSREYETLWLRFGENLSTAEVAEIMGLTQTHIKILVFRARKRLNNLNRKREL